MTTFVVPAAVSTLVAGETGHHPTPAGAKPRRQLARIWLRVASLVANPAIPIRRPKIAESDRGMVLLNEVRTKGLGSSSSNGDAVQTQKAARRTIFPRPASLVNGLSDVRPNILTFGKLGESVFQLDCEFLQVLGQFQKRGFYSNCGVRAATTISAQRAACLRHSLESPGITSPS
jgi:hypothetical protein